MPKNIYKKIHALISDCNLTDPQYRELLQDNFEVSSSKELNDFDKKRLITILYKIRDLSKKLTIYQKMYINRLIKEHARIYNIIAYISKIIKREITSIDELTIKEASKLIARLKKLKC